MLRVDMPATLATKECSTMRFNMHNRKTIPEDIMNKMRLMPINKFTNKVVLVD